MSVCVGRNIECLTLQPFRNQATLSKPHDNHLEVLLSVIYGFKGREGFAILLRFALLEHMLREDIILL
ncbi:hypothetical protein SLE2022_261550 [Rubroshorea leprosula]